MKTILLLVSLIIVSISAKSQQNRDLLQNEASRIGLKELLLNDFSKPGFPRYSDRDFWDALPPHVSAQYIAEAEIVMDYHWPVIKATDYLEILRTGNRLHEQFIHPHHVLRGLIMGELAEGKGRFMDQIVNGVWFYSEQTWWGWSAHLKDQSEADGLPDADEPIVDLGVGELVSTLSMSYLLFKDQFDEIHPFIARRVKNEVMKKAIIPFYERDDFWWMGFEPWYDSYSDSPRRLNNWNTWINYNILLGILILEDDPDKRAEGVSKVIQSIDNLLNIYPDDGGCDEGPNYWTKAGGYMYLSLDLLSQVTQGQFNLYQNPLIQNMGKYIYKASIDYPRFFNFADADATANMSPDVIFLYGKDINDQVMQKFGSHVAKVDNWGENAPRGNIDRIIMQLKSRDQILAAQPENPLISEFWLPDSEIAGARDRKGTTKGFYFAAKGGFNDESHNHNDAGTFILYYDGKPSLIDIGRETYTAKTFGPDRYEIWNMQSQYHNLPRINGFDQEFGPQYKARNTRFTSSRRKAVFTTDIAGAYPEKAAIEYWRRTYTLNRGKNFIIEDDFRLKELTDTTSLNLITYCKVTIVRNGVLELEGDGFSLYLHYDPRKLSPEIEFIETTDPRLYRFWPDGITRIVLAFTNGSMAEKNIIRVEEIK